MWTLHQQQQQRGAQMHARSGRTEQPDDTRGAPEEATRDRAAQQHDLAGHGAADPGGYPATRLEDKTGDITPTAPEPQASWDAVVQPERRPRGQEPDDQPLPEGK